MSRMDDIADRVELRALVDRCAVASDARDKERFGAVFTEDGVLTGSHGHRLEGRDAVVGVLDTFNEIYPQSMHVVGTHDITLAGDRASATVYCLSHHVIERDGKQREALVVARYLDQYERTEDGWLIAERFIKIEWQEERPLVVE